MRRLRRLLLLSACAGLWVTAGCAGSRGDARPESPPPADPAFPSGYEAWPARPAPVIDEAMGEARRLYHSPGARPGADGHWPVGTVLVKVHHDLADPTTVTRIDVRRRVADGGYGGWDYSSFDPASRRRLPADTETCHLCHAAAPADGTFTRFP